MAEKNQCEGIMFFIMPLVLVLVFSSVGKIIFPESSHDITLKAVVSWKLTLFRKVECIAGSVLIFVAIICFGLRAETRVDIWVEHLTNYYFYTILLLFIVEGAYSSFHVRLRQNREERKSVYNSSSLEMRERVDSSKGNWNIGMAAKRRTLEKDRTKRGLGKHETGPINVEEKRDFMMGPGVLAESTLAPGFL